MSKRIKSSNQSLFLQECVISKMNKRNTIYASYAFFELQSGA